jgi:hypothetical protein
MNTEFDIIKADGLEYFTGMLTPPAGLVCFAPLFEDRVPTLTKTEIEDIAKGGSADGRNLFPRREWVTDQKSHGSCNGFAGAGALTAARVRRGLEKVVLSGAYLYSLINRGRDQGSLLNEGMKALQENGCATADTVPWNAIYPRQQRPEAVAEARRFKAFECYKVGTEIGLWSALALGFDCVVAVHAGNNFMRLDANEVAGGDRGPGNHAVRADGIAWANGVPAATHIGSWNVGYGKDGGSLLTWDRHFKNTFGQHDFYAVRSTSDDPNGDNPPKLSL